MRNGLIQYCVGCGLCKECINAVLGENEKGFLEPISGDKEWLDKVCPIGNLPMDEYDISSIWGRRIAVYYGWSNNLITRRQASSGGMISEIACYLLKHKIVSGIIHVCEDPSSPTKNISTISFTEEEVISKCGSRYSISHPLEIINGLDSDKRYALIGKPCDIVAIRNYQKLNHAVKHQIPILLSFFCMGMPSSKAQELLLKELEMNIDECKSLKYRGDGWPGFTIATDKNGTSKQMDYATSWGVILGRDLMPACRFCLDGIGEAADISCGDAWYLGEDKEPDFSEHEGRNVVFARTSIGLEILQRMVEKNTITLERIDTPDNYLNQIQKSQLFRRASMRSRIAAMKFMKQPYPNYSKDMVFSYSKYIAFTERLKVFLGTCKRIIKGAI